MIKLMIVPASYKWFLKTEAQYFAKKSSIRHKARKERAHEKRDTFRNIIMSAKALQKKSRGRHKATGHYKYIMVHFKSVPFEVNLEEYFQRWMIWQQNTIVLRCIWERLELLYVIHGQLNTFVIRIIETIHIHCLFFGVGAFGGELCLGIMKTSVQDAWGILPHQYLVWYHQKP